MYVPSSLPAFTSTPEEIQWAVEQNAYDRGVLLVRLIDMLGIEALLDAVSDLDRILDVETFYEQADYLKIDMRALALLSHNAPPIHPSRYFCTPELLVDNPSLIFYYRNLAMLSNKVMRGIGMDTARFESSNAWPDEVMAYDLAVYFNEIVSNLILHSGVSSFRHIVMMMANLGDSLGGTSRNEVGRAAVARLMAPLVRRLYARQRLVSMRYTLKGQIGDNDEVETAEQELVLSPEVNLEAILSMFDEQRVKYRELTLTNGAVLRFDRQLLWENYKLGPDMHSTVAGVDLFWAAEVKGGADPAGSDEHWKTATKAMDRILEASAHTGRPKPMLSFIATILVERVAWEAKAWLDEGKLHSVYNLTRMLREPAELERFLDDMQRYLGYADGDMGVSS